MASASTSSVEESYIYDVFISFRGKDLRTSFVDHLCAAFRKSGIIVFKDDKHIEIGQKISDELPKAIKDSKFHIVIFSQRYADSYWCLNELIEILECQNPRDPTFYPIFYHVKPSEVRDQEGSVGEAFAVHSRNEAAGRWRAAMRKAATLEGWELTKTGNGHEVQFIEKIVRTISQKPYFAKFGVNDNLVGVTTRVEKLLLSLQVGFDDVRMIGITGLGGVGKTTLASVVFNRIANQFEGKSFVQNVRERSKDPRGLQDMQKQILTSVFGDQSIYVPSDVEGRNTMEKRMRSIKVLVVLDDVNNGKQLKELAKPSWFRPGSRIIITSRERQVLVAHGVQSHNIHVVSTLSNEDAIRLHCRYAFKTESPAQGYEKLSEEVVRYAAGLPLTIETLSSSLCGRPTDVWKNAIKRLETIPWGDTLKILEISYDALEKDQKGIFLHVACLLNGEKKKQAIRILKSLGFYAPVGLSDLEQKSLITFRDGDGDDDDDDDDDKELVLHDHIEEMGMHIVRRLDPDEPERHKLLWIKDEIENIIEKDMGTEAIRGIKLLYTDLDPAKISQSLIKMSKLCFLHVGWRSYYTQYKFDEAGKYLPNSLKFLHWHGYPYRYLPKTFDADKLVEMEMPYSYIHQLWEGGEKKVLPKLRLLNLSFSKLETFDSAITPNLEELVLKGCQNLVEVNISGKCSHVKKLDLSESTALEKLTISNECPLRLNLCLSHTKLRSLNLELTSNLEQLIFRNCKDLEELVMPVQCQKLTKLSLISATKLRSLNLGLTSNLEQLLFSDCKDLEELVMPVECQKLTTLSLISAPKLRSLNLGLTPNLEQLQLVECKDLEELVMSCQKLTALSINVPKLRSLNLGMTPNLEQLLLRDCKDIEELVMPVELPARLRVLSLRSFQSNGKPGPLSYLEKLEKLKSLEELRLYFVDMNHLPDNIYMLKHLRVLDLGGCRKLKQLPEDLDRLECLEELRVNGCYSLLNIPNCICKMTRLKKLNLTDCGKLKKLPDEFRRLQSLQELKVIGIADRLKNLPESISQFKDLLVVTKY